MKKNFTRQALPAVAMLMVASLSLVGTTYAWFTQNETASVSNVDVQVTDAAGGIAIASSANGTYGSTFAASTAGDLNPVSNNCVLTTTTLGAGAFTFYTADVDTANSANIISSTALTDTTGYAIIFNMYFENSGSENQSIYFEYSDVNDLFAAKTGTPAVAGGEDAEKSSYALRIAFIDNGYTNIKPSAATFTPDQGTAASVVVVEPNDKKHLSTVSTSSAAIETFGIQGVISESTPIQPTSAQESSLVGTGKVYGKQTTYTVSECNGGTSEEATQALFTLEPGYSWIQVVIWLEGQDVDCLNAISGKDLYLELKFTVNKQS